MTTNAAIRYRHALTMGQLRVEETDKELDDRRRRYSEGRRCPVCLDLMTNDSETCIHCVYEWKAIKANARALALWIAEMALYEPQLREQGVTLWQGEREIAARALLRYRQQREGRLRPDAREAPGRDGCDPAGTAA